MRRREEGSPPAAAAGEIEPGLPSRIYASVVVALRWLVPLAWIAGAVAVSSHASGISKLPVAGVRALIPGGLAAVAAEDRSARLFGSSLLPRIAVVQRDPNGLSLARQRDIVDYAVKVDRGRLPQYPKGSIAAPYVNTLKAFPAARERSTTAITYLAFPSSISSTDQRNLALQYQHEVEHIAPAAATGFLVGTLTGSDEINSHLRWVEIATVLLILVIIGLYLRSVLAPLVTLFTAGVSFVIALRAVAYLGLKTGVAVSQEVEPIIVVLLLGVVTDYSVFFLSGQRRRLRDGERPVAAVRRTAAEFIPIIFTAGWLVALGLATLRVASIGFIQALGPAMAVVVLVSLAVSVTLVPALMAILGRALFWPGLGTGPEKRRSFRYRVAGAARWKWFAMAVALLVGAALAAAASGMFGTRLALTPIRGLPSSTTAAKGDSWASQGFAPGIVSPTEVVLTAHGIGDETAKQARLASLMRRVPGVAAVVGPAVVDRLARPYVKFATANAFRYLVVFDHHPYGVHAIDDLARLERAMPSLLRRVGLGGAIAAYAGDTAIAKGTVHRIEHDVAVVTAAAFGVNFVLLALFLRALVAPVLLVLASALSLAATFGLTTYFFQGFLGHEDLTYYIPLAVGVLLLSFGSDYNLFIVGRIWQESANRPVRRAIAEATPRASRAISIAGIALALSFATLAIVPLSGFREFAFAMAVGVLLDTFVVRSYLIPAMISGTGRWSWWPGARGRLPDPAGRPSPPSDEPGT